MKIRRGCGNKGGILEKFSGGGGGTALLLALHTMRFIVRDLVATGSVLKVLPVLDVWKFHGISSKGKINLVEVIRG